MTAAPLVPRPCRQTRELAFDDWEWYYQDELHAIHEIVKDTFHESCTYADFAYFAYTKSSKRKPFDYNEAANEWYSRN